MVERILIRIGDYIFVLRPLILVPVWSFYLLGARRGAATGLTEYDGSFYGLLSLTGIMASAYLINQVFDTESDRYNAKGHYLTQRIFSVRTVVVLALVTLLAAMRAFSLAPDTQRVALVLALILSLTYSLPPIRLCAKPFLDMAANAFGYGGVAYICGYAAFHGDVVMGFWPALPWVMLVAATFLHTTILDIDGDARANKRTTSVAIGTRASALLAMIFAVSGMACAFVLPTSNVDVVARIALTLSVPVFVASYLFKKPGSAFVVQASTLIVTIAAIATAPRFLAVLAPLVIAARFYYRARFGVTYPGPPVGRGA